MSKAGAIEVLTGSNSETIIVRVAHLLSTYGAIPAIIGGLILAGMLAATMSTADSQLLAAASAVSQNLVKDCFHIKITEKMSIVVARITVIVIAVIGVFMASNPDSSVFDIVSFAWAGFGAAFGPLVLFALFWKRTNKQGAYAGILVGGIVDLVWAQLSGGIFDLYEIVPGFVCGLIAIFVVSLLTAAPSKEITDEFDSYRSCEE